MKEKIYAVVFALIIAFIAYVMVSSAARHTEIDNAKLIQWRYEHAVRP